MFPFRLSLFALIFLAVLGMLQEAEGGLVEVYVNDVDLVIAEAVVTVESETDFDVIIRLSGPYRIDSGDDNLSVNSILIQIDFLNDADPRDSVMGIPQYQPLGDNESDPGYDEFRSRFRSNDAAFEDYYGNFQIVMVMKNESSELIWDTVFDMHMAYKPKPDIYMFTMSFSNDNPEIGEEVIINATVKCLCEDAKVDRAFEVAFFLDDMVQIGTVIIDGANLEAINNGTNVHASITWIAINEYISHLNEKTYESNGDISVHADSTGVIDENTEKNEISKIIIVGFVEPEPNDTDTTSNTEETTTEAEEVEETDYTMIIAGVGAMIAASILGAAVILKR